MSRYTCYHVQNVIISKTLSLNQKYYTQIYYFFNRIKCFFKCFQRNIVKFKNKMVESYQNTPNPLIVSDYLSMMTDTYVLNDYERKFLPILHGEKL